MTSRLLHARGPASPALRGVFIKCVWHSCLGEQGTARMEDCRVVRLVSLLHVCSPRVPVCACACLNNSWAPQACRRVQVPTSNAVASTQGQAGGCRPVPSANTKWDNEVRNDRDCPRNKGSRGRRRGALSGAPQKRPEWRDRWESHQQSGAGPT